MRAEFDIPSGVPQGSQTEIAKFARGAALSGTVVAKMPSLLESSAEAVDSMLAVLGLSHD